MLKEVKYNDVTKFFVSLSNETGNLLSNLKLQKLLYYIQAWHLAKFEKELFEGKFQAWVHGPVLPSAYHDYKQYGWKPINEEIEEGFYLKFIDSLKKEQKILLKEVVEEYFGESAFDLELMTHREEPWIKARKGLAMDEPSENIIDNQWMIEYYSKFLIDG
ncbi:Panacea domain-containing protein [Lacinutrix sp. MEBiC02595]